MHAQARATGHCRTLCKRFPHKPPGRLDSTVCWRTPLFVIGAWAAVRGDAIGGQTHTQ